MKKIPFLLILLLPLLLLTPQTASPEHKNALALFLKANESYQKGDYESARDLYTRILDQGIRNGILYYNLGNTYYRLGRTGKAIENYLSAREWIPRSEDLEANLRYAREERKDRIEATGGILRELFFWYYRMSFPEMVRIFLLSNVIFWGTAAGRLFSRRPFLRGLLYISLLFGLTMGITAATRYLQTRLHRPAVIIVPKASVRSGMDPESTTLFVLHDGAEGWIDRTRDGWVLFRLPSGKEGWLKKAQVGKAALPYMTEKKSGSSSFSESVPSQQGALPHRQRV
ncbi:MAG: tetratricopeptide repeat protein [Deltaproteobacteria bacterium]|nr:tetratricopeptide repeat protein [Deltaproteobacteria bacterium]